MSAGCDFARSHRFALLAPVPNSSAGLSLPPPWELHGLGGFVALTLASAEGLEGGLVPERVLSRLDDELEAGVDGLLGLLSLLGRNHCFICGRKMPRVRHRPTGSVTGVTKSDSGHTVAHTVQWSLI